LSQTIADTGRGIAMMNKADHGEKTLTHGNSNST